MYMISFLITDLSNLKNGSDCLFVGVATRKNTHNSVFKTKTKGSQWRCSEAAEANIQTIGKKRISSRRCVSDTTGKPSLGTRESQWLLLPNHRQFFLPERFRQSSWGYKRTLEGVPGETERYERLFSIIVHYTEYIAV